MEKSAPLTSPSDPPTSRGGGRHIVAIVGAMIIWSTSFVGTKLAYESFPPLTLGAARFVVASVILLVLAWRMKLLILPPARDLGRMALSGFFGITLYFAMENIGVSLTSASNAALIMASYPAITMLMEWIFYGIRVSPRKWLGLAMAVLGVACVSGLGAGGGGRNELLGNIILSATGIVWALYNFTTRSVVNKYPSVTVSLYQTLAGTVVFIPIAFIEYDAWVRPSVQSLAVMLYLGVFCSVAAFMLFNYALRTLTAGAAVSFSNLVPVFGVLFSVIVLEEAVSAWQLLGGAVVIVGVYLSVHE